jgi:hypothetical protein
MKSENGQLKIIVGLLMLSGVFSGSRDAFAGGAVARRQQTQGAQQRAVQERKIQEQMIQERMIQERMIQERMRQKVIEEKLRRDGLHVEGGSVEAEIFVPTDKLSPPVEEKAAQVVPITQIFEALIVNSQPWPLMMDQGPKQEIVQYFIGLYRGQGVEIRKPAAFYVNVIDSIITQNPGFLQQPFPNILRIAAIMEYDFRNGQNPDYLARQLLGENGYKQNKARLQNQQR